MTGNALITGGHTGIGLGIARALLGAGFEVVLASEADPDAPEVTAALDELGPAARYVRHDVRDVHAHSAFVDEIERERPLTTFVSNAGVPARVRGDMLALEPDNFDAVLSVNLRGGFFFAQQIARRMVERDAGPYRSMTFVTSVSATMVSPERAEYCVSKAGAAMMADLFAVRLAPHGIGVFQIRPGIIETGMTAGVRDAYSARIEGGLVPQGRWGLPGDVGSVIVPIARGDLAYSAGAVIPVDGGLSIPRL